MLDLFSGPGGMSQGIRDARNHGLRFRVVAANDYDQAVKSTYTRNHRDTEFVSGSITDEETKRDIIRAIKRNTGRHGVDLVVGGPPCKGFSLENKMTRNMNNPMNHLVHHYVDMIRRTKPMAFIMENVPGLFAMNGGKVVDSLIDDFKDMGYHNATAWLLNAAEYGVPQVRKRAFIVGSKSRIPIEKPRKTHGTNAEIAADPSLSSQVSIIECIGDLPKIRSGKIMPEDDSYTDVPSNQFQKKMRARSSRITNHIITKNSPQVIDRIKVVPPGGNWSSIPAKLMRAGGRYKKLGLAHSMIYRRLKKNDPSITITNFRKAMIIHPTQNRLLSVREAARIQTFPDHFEFKGGISNMQQQVSDAVPVLLAKKVGDAMLLHLHKILVPVQARQQRLRNKR
ncbi:MAG: DNA cytosine methyltransferase [Gammaproteobacteria bacterium]|nr:DNA cytosine methyltransferase [Gammaproteobacteria bacterium]